MPALTELGESITGEAIKIGVSTKTPDVTYASSTLQSSGTTAGPGTLPSPRLSIKGRFEVAQPLP